MEPGVEEQFYIVWPLLLWVAYKRRIHPSLLTFSLLASSLALNIWLVQRDSTAAFYSPLTRFWELLCGALLALYSLRGGKGTAGRSADLAGRGPPDDQGPRRLDHRGMLSSAVSCVGLALLLLGVLRMNKELTFPGWWALVPVAGATMLIFAGPRAWLNRRLLSNKVLVWFGLTSFPLYLWHWPLLSFGRIVYFDDPPLRYRVIAVLVSIGLAWLTTKYVEKPLRYGRRHSSRKVFGLSGSLVVIALAGLVLFVGDFRKSHTFDQLVIRRKGEYAIGSSLGWYQGKDGWLFLGNAYDHSVAKLKLAMKPGEPEVDKLAQSFAKVSEADARFGARTVLIVGPNKSSIYPEYLPKGLTPSPVRYSSFFLEKLIDIPGLAVYDPTSDLLAAKKSQGLLYWKTDTHWNNKGAYLAFAGFARLVNVRPPDVTFTQGSTHRGDLISISGLKDFPLDRRDNWDVVWRQRPAWTEQEIPGEQKTPFGAPTLVTNDRPISRQSVWVVGDSFVEALKPYFNATFHKVRYIGHWRQKLQTLPEEIGKAAAKPDLIVIVRGERSF